MTTTLLKTALTAHRAGLCVLPPKEDGSKRPDAVRWVTYQGRSSTEEEIRRWYEGGRTGLGLVCGAVSGNLELLEFEGRAVDEGLWKEFKAAAKEVGLEPLLVRITRGLSERSPSGGIHLIYRCNGVVEGNTELARRPATPEELEETPTEKVKVLIETRGEGGYVVVAPSNGNVHPTGKRYEMLSGGFDSIATITAEEREALLELARSFDRTPTEEWKPPAGGPKDESAGLQPGDDFNARADWAKDVLEPAGWSFTGRRSGRDHWYRGASGQRGWTSATISPDGQYLYAFSTSTDLPTRKGLSKFRVYAFLHHDGDFRAAASELRQKGYGAPPEPTGVIRHNTTAVTEPVEAPAQPQATPFPAKVLPDVLRTWVTSASEAIQCQPDVLATFALSAASAAIGASRKIVLKNSWSELPCLWTAVVGPPGLAKKSPALKAAMQPLHQWQRDRINTFKVALAHHQADLEAWESLPKRDRPSKPQPPALDHLVVNDITIEKLADVLSQNSRLILERDELVGWVGAMNQYRAGKGSDRQQYLSIWSAQPIKIDRKLNPIPIYVPRPFLSITGGLQPSTVSLLRSDQYDDGLFERLLWSWPDLPQNSDWTDAEIDSDAMEAYRSLIYKLLELRPDVSSEGEEYPRSVFLSPAAKELWQYCYNEHQRRTKAENDQVGLLAKIPGQAARLILTDHEIRQASGERLSREIEEISVLAGWNEAEYYISHGCRVLGLAGRTSEDERADKLVDWIKLRGGTVTARDVVRSGAAGIRKTTDAVAALHDLADRGRGVVSEKSVRGGRQVKFAAFDSKGEEGE